MQKNSRRRARQDTTPQISAVTNDATSPVDGIDQLFYTDPVIVPSSTAGAAADDATALPAIIDPGTTASQEAPAMTRRELREREAKAASRSLLFAAPSVDTPNTAPRAEGRVGRKRARARRLEASQKARRGTARTRSVRLASSARPGGRPRVAATVLPAPSKRSASRGTLKRRLLSQFISISAMAGVGLILVATTVPANAFSRPEAIDESSEVVKTTEPLEAQELEVASVAAPTVTRDAYTVISQKQQVAAKYGNRLMLYTNNPNGTIQWPFPTGVPITSGFGGRQVAGCGFCSTNHLGVDFTPGAGTPIQSIADGTVSMVEVSNGGLGNHVMVDHVVNGQKVQSEYAHMQFGSIKVAVGQQVKVGDIVGNVGSTGASTGAHLHLEVHLDGTPVDPFAWLQANAN